MIITYTTKPASAVTTTDRVGPWPRSSRPFRRGGVFNDHPRTIATTYRLDGAGEAWRISAYPEGVRPSISSPALYGSFQATDSIDVAQWGRRTSRPATSPPPDDLEPPTVRAWTHRRDCDWATTADLHRNATWTREG